ncbi:4'-phosphopantetheinyl transferase superfamily protein [Massilia sp. Root351]|uniref:4'-phosphopantetheinyl transferase family protein n=1 Tax=Massilia sp. Root351 TaxID=1736522 RepID=UPI00138EEBAD|nr:4'-phosphopantetheinyl transferase superfamily protein [Massilia sp. Root351]
MENPSASVWLLDSADLDAALVAAWLAQLGESELHRFHSFKREVRRTQFLAGRVLLRRAFRDAGIHPHAISVVERHGHAPVVHIAGLAQTPYFSLSHSGRWIGCAVSSVTPVGIDIEIMRAGRDFGALAAHVFCEHEAKAIAALPESERPYAFYSLWSRREAEFKLGMTPSYYHPLPHPSLAIALCAAQPIHSSRFHTYCMRVQDC